VLVLIIAIVIGGAVLVAMLLGMVRSDPSISRIAAATVLGGIVIAGSNRSTAKKAPSWVFREHPPTKNRMGKTP
jgi:hypothetical protein